MNSILVDNKYVLVDGKDFDYLSKFKWYLTGRNKTYVSRKLNGKTIYMHREIANASGDKQVDHINDNPLDNRRINLRICSNSQNNANKSITCKNTSGYKGVVWSRDKNRYMVRIMVNRKSIFLGYFNSAIDAAKAYDESAKKYFGEFARLNLESR